MDGEFFNDCFGIQLRDISLDSSLTFQPIRWSRFFFKLIPCCRSIEIDRRALEVELERNYGAIENTFNATDRNSSAKGAKAPARVSLQWLPRTTRTSLPLGEKCICREKGAAIFSSRGLCTKCYSFPAVVSTQPPLLESRKGVVANSPRAAEKLSARCINRFSMINASSRNHYLCEITRGSNSIVNRDTHMVPHTVRCARLRMSWTIRRRHMTKFRPKRALLDSYRLSDRSVEPLTRHVYCVPTRVHARTRRRASIRTDTPVSQPRRAIMRGRGHIGYLAGITPDHDRPSK
ncbi:hypothetical protein DBV15_08535 [Temnothorax longispinosus]|uniref:Uncharacterized protein n=1 Tax=Temnothorax longispinosus TaxID=300112 RepID=A0A4S2KTH1_9HYME|nr:hypothetical protein DBV15_08535 [Temnothorax longispinosus]